MAQRRYTIVFYAAVFIAAMATYGVGYVARLVGAVYFAFRGQPTAGGL